MLLGRKIAFTCLRCREEPAVLSFFSNPTRRCIAQRKTTGRAVSDASCAKNRGKVVERSPMARI
jgi:hypothetical protein